MCVVIEDFVLVHDDVSSGGTVMLLTSGTSPMSRRVTCTT